MCIRVSACGNVDPIMASSVVVRSVKIEELNPDFRPVIGPTVCALLDEIKRDRISLRPL